MIRLEQLGKSFGTQRVLRNIDLEIKSGCVTAIVGPNGSGKSTTIKCILGLVKPDHGSVVVNDQRVNGDCEYRRGIGYMAQIAHFPENLKVRNVFELVKDVRNGESATVDEELINRFNLEREFHKKLKNLSGGTRQKVNASLAFLFNPGILILDEPTASLDPVASRILKEKIHKEKAKGKTILLTSHIMSEVEELSDEIVFLLEGNIFYEGTKQDLMASSENNGLEHVIARMMEGAAA